MSPTRSDDESVCRVAFVGGGATIREHVRAFAAVPNVEIVGLTNRTRDRAEAIAAELGVPLVGAMNIRRVEALLRHPPSHG